MGALKGPGPVAYCGLCCDDCFNYRGEVADLARDLRKKLREERFDKVAPGLSKYFKDFKDYETCYRVLGTMVRLRCKKGCRDGGGNPGCRIRMCCQKKGLRGCWDCGEFEGCEKHQFLKPIHGEENVVNLRQMKRDGKLRGSR